MCNEKNIKILTFEMCRLRTYRLENVQKFQHFACSKRSVATICVRPCVMFFILLLYYQYFSCRRVQRVKKRL